MVGPKDLRVLSTVFRVIAPSFPLRSAFWSFPSGNRRLNCPESRTSISMLSGSTTTSPVMDMLFSLDLKGRFDAERAKAQNIPVRLWSRLQKGEIIETEEGAVLTPDMVLGPARKGLKAGLFHRHPSLRKPCQIRTGRRPSDLRRNVRRTGKCCKGTRKKHMTFTEAADIARKAGPKQMWLTHYSPS